jgi:hypothetical protein
MKIGTKSLLFGVHQFFWHPLTVFRAWKRLYGRPNLRESICILVHDWGYWRAGDMDGSIGGLHPELGARIIGRLFDDAHRDLVLLHSRRYARGRGLEPSKLCWADKLSIMYDPDWFYLLRARASGELDEYRHQAGYHIPIQQSDRAWLRWIKKRSAKSAFRNLPWSSSKPWAIQIQSLTRSGLSLGGQHRILRRKCPSWT